MEHGLAGLNEGGKVEDAVEGLSLGFCCGEDVFKPGTILQLSFYKLDSWGQKIATAMAKIVINDDLGSIIGQQPRDSTTYIPRTTSNKDFHEKTRPSQTL
jgi:hypothetical protein